MGTPKEEADRRSGNQSLLNHEFLMSLDLKPYKGEWVSIVDTRLVAHGEDCKKVYDETMKQYPGKVPFLHFVPSQNMDILLGPFFEE